MKSSLLNLIAQFSFMEEKSLHENLPYEEMYYVELEIGALPSHSSRQ